MIPEVDGENKIASWVSNDAKVDRRNSPSPIPNQAVPPKKPREYDDGDNIQEKLRSTLMFFGEKNLQISTGTEASTMTAGSVITTKEYSAKLSPNHNHFRMKTFRGNSYGTVGAQQMTPLSQRIVLEGGPVTPFMIKQARLDTDKSATLSSSFLPGLKKPSQPSNRWDLKRSFGGVTHLEGANSSRFSSQQTNSMSKSTLVSTKANYFPSARQLKEEARLQALKEIFNNKIGAKRIQVMLDREEKSKTINIPSQLDIKKILPSHKRDQYSLFHIGTLLRSVSSALLISNE